MYGGKVFAFVWYIFLDTDRYIVLILIRCWWTFTILIFQIFMFLNPKYSLHIFLEIMCIIIEYSIGHLGIMSEEKDTSNTLVLNPNTTKIIIITTVSLQVEGNFSNPSSIPRIIFCQNLFISQLNCNYQISSLRYNIEELFFWTTIPLKKNKL
jgi:hypothetical protein